MAYVTEKQQHPKGIGTWEAITPGKAKHYLQTNTANYRRMKTAIVKQYAADMKNGKWEPNGEPIVIDEDGVLKNGQHRLAAVYESGETVEMFVIHGVSRDVTLYDDHSRRTAVDHAGAMGIEADSRLMALAGRMVRDFNTGTGGEKGKYSARDAALYIKDHRNELQSAISISRIGSINGVGVIAKSWAQLVVYLLIRNGMSTSVITDFFTVLNSGLPLQQESTPALVTRNMYLFSPAVRGAVQMVEAMVNLANAIDDFACGKSRRNRYTLKIKGAKWDENKLEELWHDVRRKDGLEQ